MKTIMAIITLLFVGSTVTSNASDLFTAKETTLSFFGTYVDQTGDDWGLGAGVTHFITRHLGVGAVTHWENFDGPFFDNLAGEAYFRLPLGSLPLAPYAVGAVGYTFENDEWFESFGAGAEWRFSKKLGVFGDFQWQFNNDTDDGVGLRIGARLTF